MRTEDEEIAIEVEEIRKAGYFGELHIVPTVNKRCFAPCGKGNCNCFPTVGQKWCIVKDSALKFAQKEFLSEIHRLEEKINKV